MNSRYIFHHHENWCIIILATMHECMLELHPGLCCIYIVLHFNTCITRHNGFMVDHSVNVSRNRPEAGRYEVWTEPYCMVMARRCICCDIFQWPIMHPSAGHPYLTRRIDFKVMFTTMSVPVLPARWYIAITKLPFSDHNLCSILSFRGYPAKRALSAMRTHGE